MAALVRPVAAGSGGLGASPEPGARLGSGLCRQRRRRVTCEFGQPWPNQRPDGPSRPHGAGLPALPAMCAGQLRVAQRRPRSGNAASHLARAHSIDVCGSSQAACPPRRPAARTTLGLTWSRASQLVLRAELSSRITAGQLRHRSVIAEPHVHHDMACRHATPTSCPRPCRARIGHAQLPRRPHRFSRRPRCRTPAPPRTGPTPTST